MRIAVLGTNHKFANVAYREQWIASISEFLSEMESSMTFSYVLLFSCNRCEIYFCSSDLSQAIESLERNLKKKLPGLFYENNYFHVGYECFLHLSLVASGLDSAQLGETDIRRQIRESYRNAQQRRKLPSELHYLFQKSLKIGKQALMGTSKVIYQTSLEEVIFKECLKVFKDIEGKKAFFWGNSQITRKIIHYLSCKANLQFIVCSKTKAFFSDIKQVKVVDYSDFSLWKEADMVFCATSQNSCTIPFSIDSARPRLICDLSVPRLISPDVAIPVGVTLLNMDYFNTLLQRNHLFYKEQVDEIKQEVEILVERSFLIFEKKTKILQILQGKNLNGCCISL